MLMKRNFELSSNNTMTSLLFFQNSLRAFFSTVKCSYVYIFFISISDFLMLTSHNVIAKEKTCYINQNEIWIHAKNIHFFYNHGTKVIGTWINIQFRPRRNHKKVSIVHSHKNTFYTFYVFISSNAIFLYIIGCILKLFASNLPQFKIYRQRILRKIWIVGYNFNSKL